MDQAVLRPFYSWHCSHFGYGKLVDELLPDEPQRLFELGRSVISNPPGPAPGQWHFYFRRRGIFAPADGASAPQVK
jgi:hypothetical protein